MKKKLIALIAITCCVVPLYGMRNPFGLNAEHLLRIQKAHDDYCAAIAKLDPHAIAHATEEIKKIRGTIPWWKRWVGYSQLTAHERFDVTTLLSDGWLLRHFETRLDSMAWKDREDRKKELSDIRDTIIEHLGYGSYIKARNAYSQLIASAKICDSLQVKNAVVAIDHARKKFSWVQKLGLAYWTEGDCPFYAYKEYIASDDALAQEVLSQMAHCKDVAQAQTLLTEQEPRFHFRVLATRESQRTDGFAGNHFQNPAVLEAFYRLKTPLNNERLLEYARRQNNKVMEQVIRDLNPDLKI